MKNKYYIETEMCENIVVARMAISEKEYKRQIKILRNQVTITKDYETPVIEPEWSGKTFDHPGCTEYIVCFNSGCCTTYLGKITAKEGYTIK